MQYELIPNFDRGILIERTPVMRDIRDTYKEDLYIPSTMVEHILDIDSIPDGVIIGVDKYEFTGTFVR